jgi:tetratricopeptide (TPR) repeat protein
MKEPSSLSDRTLPELKQIVSDFPCFQAARMLYLKNLAALDDIRLEVELKKMAIHVPDRMQLFLLLEDGRYARIPAREKKGGDKFSLIDNFLSARDNDRSDELQYESSPGYTIEDEASPDNAPEAGAPYQDLIDSLANKTGSGRMHARKADDADRNDSDDADDDFAETNNTIPSSESYFTETLAEIYIRQKRYEKALEIIRKLSLNYPKKNIYFADQIRFLEKLIIHTKTN